MVRDFLFELGCEELPSAAVWPLADELLKQVLLQLDKAQLHYGESQCFATPRRLAFIIKGLDIEQDSQIVTRKGPAVIQAFDDNGQPKPALLGFAKSCGVELAKLKKQQTDKGEWMVYEEFCPGKKTTELMPQFILHALKSLPIPKPMRWGDGDEEFARPVHWAVMLFGDEVIHHPVLGVTSDRFSRGHRFHAPEAIPIDAASQYEARLKDGFVIADFASRKAEILAQINRLADTLNASALIPSDLLDEVTSIVEWPQALIAGFNPDFLKVPKEALIASMQSHQKCFALIQADGSLLPHFITVSNIASTNPRQVVTGNEKVMRARLSDAAFFYEQDRKHPLETHIPALEAVVFQAKLGSVHEKTMRVKALMSHFSSTLNIPLVDAERAADLSKCDLLTGMVGEFPELQGLMGYYYALHDGESPVVAQSLNEQYMPRFSGDALPVSNLGFALSLADRLDTLVGIFAIGQRPTGVKDPFKLRRHALAVVRLLIALPAQINLKTLLHETFEHFGGQLPVDKTILTELKLFILERLNSYYQGQNVPVELIWAVRAKQDEWLFDLNARLDALRAFVHLPEASALSAACKRVGNLLSQAGDAIAPDASVDGHLLQMPSEKALHQAVEAMKKRADVLYQQGEYQQLLTELAALRAPVDAFFEEVMVMVNDFALRRNRLVLLKQLQELLQGVADISLLQMT